MISFGLFQFFVNEIPSYSWQRYFIKNGIASVEFPASPTASEMADTIDGVLMYQSDLIYKVPYKDISLRLSFSPVEPDDVLPEAERYEAYEDYFVEQGFTTIRKGDGQFGTASGYIINFEKDDGKIRVWTKTTVVADGLYLVTVVSAGNFHDDEVIKYFLQSFRIGRVDS